MAKMLISKPSWQTQLRSAIARLPKADHPFRLAIVGIGSEMDGDDAIGPSVIHSLQRRLEKDRLAGNVLLVDAGPSPEGFTGKLRQFQPDLVLLIDAAALGLEPGEISWLPWQETGGMSASSHSLPLAIFSHYLTVELNCQVVLLGIQPQQLELGKPLSLPARSARNRIVRSLTSIIFIF